MKTPTFALCVLSLCAITVSGSAQEWSRFRGPNGSGISSASTIPDRITDQSLLWSLDLPAGGHSSPVLWESKVFLIGSPADDPADRCVMAIDGEGGELLWSKTFASKSHRVHKFNSFASASAAATEDRVYVSWTTPEAYTVVALDHNGTILWERDLGPFESEHGGGVSPIVFDDLLIVPNEQKGASFLSALHRETGETAWKIERPHRKTAYCTPCVRVRPDGSKELIFSSGANGITGVNPETGKINWNMNDDLFRLRSVSSPVLVSGLVIGTCGSGAGGNYVVAVKPPDAAQGAASKKVYSIERSAPYVPTPVARDNLLFLWSDGGIVTCVDGASGAGQWRERVGGNFFSSPIRIRDRLINVSTSGEMIVLQATAAFEEISRHDFKELCHATPAVANGRLYVRTYRHLHCIGAEKKLDQNQHPHKP